MQPLTSLHTESFTTKHVKIVLLQQWTYKQDILIKNRYDKAYFLKNQLVYFKLLSRLSLLNYYFHAYLQKLKLIISVNEVGKIRIPVMSVILVCSLLEKLCGMAWEKKKGKESKAKRVNSWKSISILENIKRNHEEQDRVFFPPLFEKSKGRELVRTCMKLLFYHQSRLSKMNGHLIMFPCGAGGGESCCVLHQFPHQLFQSHAHSTFLLIINKR